MLGAANSYHNTYITFADERPVMVLEHFTMFEIHLDGAQFGPRSIGGDEDGAEEAGHDQPIDAESTETTDGRSPMLALVLIGALAAGVGLLWRRSRAGDVDVDVTFDDEAEADLVEAD